MKKAAVYLRVSTDKQNELNQEPPCLEVCRQREWTPVLYREVEGGTKKRPVWDRLIEDVRTARVGAVVVYSINRIGRRRIQIAGDLTKLARYGASVVSVCESFVDVDSSPDMASTRDLLIQWWGWFAEREREEIVTRTRSALERVKANIQRDGFHITHAGQTIKKLGRPAEVPEEWRARALALYLAGEKNFAAIARQLERDGGPAVARHCVRYWVASHASDERRAEA